MLFPIVITTNTNHERTTTNYGKALVTLNKILDPKFKNIKRIDPPDRDALFPRFYLEINLFNNQKPKQQ